MARPVTSDTATAVRKRSGTVAADWLIGHYCISSVSPQRTAHAALCVTLRLSAAPLCRSREAAFSGGVPAPRAVHACTGCPREALAEGM